MPEVEGYLSDHFTSYCDQRLEYLDGGMIQAKMKDGTVIGPCPATEEEYVRELLWIEATELYSKGGVEALEKPAEDKPAKSIGAQDMPWI